MAKTSPRSRLTLWLVALIGGVGVTGSAQDVRRSLDFLTLREKPIKAEHFTVDRLDVVLAKPFHNGQATTSARPGMSKR